MSRALPMRSSHRNTHCHPQLVLFSRRRKFRRSLLSNTNISAFTTVGYPWALASSTPSPNKQQQKPAEFYLLWLSSSWLSCKTLQTLSIPDLILHPTHTKNSCFSVSRKNKSATARAAAFGKAVDLNGSSTPEMSQLKDFTSRVVWNWRGVGGD